MTVRRHADLFTIVTYSSSNKSCLAGTDRTEDGSVLIVGTGKRRIIGISIFGILVSLLFWINRGTTTTSISEAKEWALQDDLWTMRSLIRDYTAAQHKRPESLHELVAAGYIKHIPKDPMTGRDDTWIVERSNESAMPGIVNVRSSASGTSSKGSRYTDW